jgi:hypothetical protein
MRFKRVSPRELLSLCDAPGAEDGSDPREFHKKPTGKVPNRKALQLCGQIARTLSLVLMECSDGVLRELLVEAVQPAPTSARLLVTLSAPDGMELEPVLQRVLGASGLLRRKAVEAIHRRKAPELTFRIARRET